jgi:uncharacterized protein (DUF952 family)
LVTDRVIYHWCPAGDWNASGDEYASPSLETEGFIHCSSLHQVARTATAVDRGHDGLILLCIDESAVPVTYEDCYELGEEYPHIYGTIPRRAVIAAIPFPPEPDGSFRLPEGVLSSPSR